MLASYYVPGRRSLHQRRESTVTILLAQSRALIYLRQPPRTLNDVQSLRAPQFIEALPDPNFFRAAAPGCLC